MKKRACLKPVDLIKEAFGVYVEALRSFSPGSRVEFFDEHYREMLALHEAAHTVIGHMFGGTVRYVKITKNLGGECHVTGGSPFGRLLTSISGEEATSVLRPFWLPSFDTIALLCDRRNAARRLTNGCWCR